MPTKNYDGDNILRYAQRLSWAKKKANDFQWAKDVANYFDLAYDETKSVEKRKRLKFNYDLFRGSGEQSMPKYIDGSIPEAFRREGLSVAEYENLRHHDIISPMLKELIGEQIKRPLSPIAHDSSEYSMNIRKKRKVEMLQDYIRKTIVEPIQQQETFSFMMENQITDPYSLSPEQQQQAQQAISQRVESKTPTEINDYLRKDFRSPAELQAQSIVDYLMQSQNLKYTFDEGFKHAMITGEEVYRVGVEHNEPKIELVNPMGFSSSASESAFFIEDGEWAKYEEYITLADVYDRYGDVLSKSDIDKLTTLTITPQQNVNDVRERIESELVRVVSNNPERYLQQGIDQRTHAGQRRLLEIRKDLRHTDNFRSLIRCTDITWISARMLYYVHRKTKDGSVVEFWADESYQYDELKGDFKIEKKWVKQAWRVVKLGEQNQENAIFPIIGPIPYQYKSLSNPWGVKLPYIGLKYGKLFDNTDNVAPLDLMKPWQFKYNRILARIEEKESMDIGKVLLVWMSIKPDDFEWIEWMAMLRYGRVSPVDLEDAGVTPQDLANIRTLDLSHTFDLGALVEYSERIRMNAGLAIGINASRLGEFSPYSSNKMNEQNLFQSRNQTEDWFRSHNMVVQNVLNEAVGCTRIAWKDNPPKKTFLLDDMSVAELDLDWEVLKRSEIGVFVRMSGSDIQNLEMMKLRSLEMIQNGLITFDEMVKLQLASSPAEIINLAEKAELRRQEAQQRAAEAERQEKEMDRQLEMAKQDKEAQLRMAIEQLKGEISERNSQRDMMKFAAQYDIDGNEINDGLQKELMTQQFEERFKELEMALEEMKIQYDYEINKEKNEIERMKVEKMNSGGGNN